MICTVSIGDYPELKIAKKGTLVWVYGEISRVDGLDIYLEQVMLEFIEESSIPPEMTTMETDDVPGVDRIFHQDLNLLIQQTENDFDEIKGAEDFVHSDTGAVAYKSKFSFEYSSSLSE